MLEIPKGQRIQHRVLRKDGRYIWIESIANAQYDLDGNFYRIVTVTRDISRQVRTQQYFEELNRAFLSFTALPLRNIHILLEAAGKLLGADFVMYNRLREGMIYTAAHWNKPDDFDLTGAAAGTICDDVISRGGDEPVVITDIRQTKYAQAGSMLETFGVETYVGQAVRSDDDYIGAVCLMYYDRHQFNDESMRILSIVASAVGVEESRLRADEALRRAKQDVEQINEELALANREARQLALAAKSANEMKSRFLADMSHEIRTPMNAVLGYTDLLLKTELDDLQRHHLETIKQSGQALLNLLGEILDLSRIESGRVELQVRPFALRGLLKSAIDVVSIRAREKGLDLAFVFDDRIPEAVVGDPDRIRQIALNLLGNAVKFTERGGVTLRVENMPESADPDHTALHLSVEDTGIGIPTDKLAGVLQPFVQANHEISRQYGGSGLGLAICRQLVERMGGRIWVESPAAHDHEENVKGPVSGEGPGSVFHVVLDLPISDRPPEDAAPLSAEAEHLPHRTAGKKLRLLMAEDDAVNRQLAGYQLRSEGYDLTTVTNGREAVEIFDPGAFDIVLMDIQMPGMDGWEATRKIRAIEKRHAAEDGAETRRVPIIAMTAFAMQGDRQRCLDAGMDDYIAKPVDIDNLRILLRKWGLSDAAPEPACPASAMEEGAPTETTEEACMDMDAAMRIVKGNKTLLRKILEYFIKAYPDMVRDIRRAMEEGDATRLSRRAHKLKGQLANIYAGPARDTAFALEQRGYDGNLENIDLLIAQLETQLETLHKKITGPDGPLSGDKDKSTDTS
jgi:signal transduction histidine kinase/DNA-binding response OmpR family regulator